MRVWLRDFLWAVRMIRARRFHRYLMFSQRQKFHAALRPRLAGEPDRVIAYPDAFWHVMPEDIDRAISAARRPDPPTRHPNAT